MIGEPTDSNTSDETEILRLRPAWRSFFVYFFGIFVCVGGPLLKDESPIPLWLGLLFGAVFLIIIIRWRLNLYVLTNHRLRVESAPFATDRKEILLADIVDITVNQGVTSLRLMNAGHVLISSKRPDQANVILRGLMKPFDFKKQLEALIAEATAGQDRPVA